MSAAARQDGLPPEGGQAPVTLLRSPTAPGAAPVAPSGLEHAVAVADAVLYEGYLLYPYRRSSPKNRVRWQFGVLAPRNFVVAAGTADTGVAGSADAWYQQTDCLLEPRSGSEARSVRVVLRFLQVQHRAAEAPTPDGGWAEVDALDVDGQRHLTFDEAVPREVEVDCGLDELRDGPRTWPATAPGGEEIEELRSGSGVTVGRIVRRRRPVQATMRLELSPAEAPFPLHRLRLVVENTADAPEIASRPDALRISLVAAHSLLALRGSRFVSLLEPPVWAAVAAGECRNVHTYPVLAGRDGGRDVVLSSPIILYDHPQIAPESPGPLFDSGEIDEILSLRTMTLTDDEKREVRATDPQAAALLDRVDHLPEEVLARLHGAVRSLRPVRRTAPAVRSEERAWWEPGADDDVRPETDAVVVDGVRVSRGSRVRLRPRPHGTDAHDVFLAGRTARVEAVLLDVDGSRFVAVVLDDDPGADLFDWYGRHYQFAPEEIEPLPGDGPR
ncbi:hypothetical protein SAMN04515665_1036 [Blastococcus sp. DSM 46786]|uniref:hypothetical protein n=1 Tax=Blastococcus sp. DSM 46786 TaxID=1798227 RepID=UPI0008B75EDF|nr:hypothetical protein [Blastococcus sp. DSM 46786]SEK54821.1 hypothetical protein SAMN04515665_1036 [Blastococcus sp. DSM 46786]